MTKQTRVPTNPATVRRYDDELPQLDARRVMLDALRHCLAFAEHELELRAASADPEYIGCAQYAVDTARAAIALAEGRA